MAEWFKALHLKCKEGDFRRFESCSTRKGLRVQGKDTKRDPARRSGRREMMRRISNDASEA